MRSFFAFLRLPAREQKLLIECWIELARAAVVTRLRPASICTNAKVAFKNLRLVSDGFALEALLLWVDRAASHHLKHMTCLERAVAGQRVLMRRGWFPLIEIGVRGGHGDWEAHAWLSLAGRSLDRQSGLFASMQPVALPR